MTKYKWYAEWKFCKGMYLCIDDGDGECGMMEPTAYVGDEPTLFRTKEACKYWMKEWPRGSFIIKKKEV